jgi:hypothetical protein
MSLFRDCITYDFTFQPKGRRIKIKIQIKEGKMYIMDKPFLHEFTFKNKHKIFINDEKDNEYPLKPSTISVFLNNLLKHEIIAIKNSKLILVE